MFNEFKSLISRGNVLDLAVAVIVGAAFGNIVTALTEDVIMPLIGAATGGLDFSSYFVRLADVPASYTGSLADYAALKKAGVPLLGFGSFLTAVLNFLIVALAIFLLIKSANRAAGMSLGALPPTPEDVRLLRQIRDELRSVRGVQAQKDEL
jgi:large conductance mechanosensitive channel